MKNKLFLLLFLTFATLYAFPLDLNTSHRHIGKSMTTYEDTEAALNFSQVLQLPEDSFKRTDQETCSYPFTSSAHWYKFSLNNTQDKALSRLLIFEPAWLDYIQVNIVSEDGGVEQYEVGNTFNFSKRSIEHHFSNRLHDFKPGISTVYIQVKTRDPFVFTVSIMDENAFLLNQQKEFIFIGVLYGVIFAMLLYNLFLFFGVREQYYAYYVLFVASFLIANASYNGYTFNLFFAQLPELQNYSQVSTIFLFSFTALLFARSFLNLKKTHYKLEKATKNISAVLIVVALVSAVAGYRYHAILAITLSAVISAYIFAIAIYVWKKGNRSALFFILGTFGGLMGTIITALTVMGQIPYSHLAYKALDIGMIVDAMLLSLALADRIRLAREEKSIAEAEKTIAEAETLLARKEAKTDVLTGLMNRRGYYEITNRESNRSSRYHMNMSLVLLDIDYFKDFNDNYGHDVGDMVLKHFAKILMRLKRAHDYAFRLGGDEFLVLLPQTSKNEAHSLAKRIQDEIASQPLKCNNHTHTITVSFGIAQYKESDISIDQIEKRADIALYKAKALEKANA